MNKPAELILLGALGLGCLLPQGCATQSGSVGGDEYAEEQIDEPRIKHILPPEYSINASRPRPSRAELSALNATGLPAGALSDVLFDFDEAVYGGTRSLCWKPTQGGSWMTASLVSRSRAGAMKSVPPPTTLSLESAVQRA